MGFRLNQAPPWNVGFGKVGQIKVETENCICGGNGREPREGSIFSFLGAALGADTEAGACGVCDPTGQSQDDGCLGEEGI